MGRTRLYDVTATYYAAVFSVRSQSNSIVEMKSLFPQLKRPAISYNRMDG